MLQQNCALCVHRNPVVHDEMVADPVEEQTDVDRYADINKIEAMGSEEKWQFFEDLLSPCIRCYACRNACPLCYCPTCFVTSPNPSGWAKARTLSTCGLSIFCGPTIAPVAVPTAAPASGHARWVSTCDCSRASWKRTARISSDGKTGLSLDQRPALDAYQANDPETFIK